MADKSTILQDPKTGENIYPVTITDNIYLPNGTPLMKYLNTIPLPLGTLIHSTKIIKSAGLHLADGGELMIGGVYDDFCKYVIANQSEFPILYDDEDLTVEGAKTALEKWQETFATYGQCGNYVITDTYIKLPAITKLSGGLVSTEMTKIASMNEAGLPNIKDKLSARAVNYNLHSWLISSEKGVFSNDSSEFSSVYTDAKPTSNSGAGKYINFDLSKANPIYGKSATVETEYVKFPYYIVVATVTKTDIEVDIDNVASDLNNKADKDLGNIVPLHSVKSTFSSYPMPSNTYETLTGTNGGTYTAPANGWFAIDATTSSGNAYKMTDFTNNTNGMYIRMQGWGGSARITNIIPVKKGDVVKLGLSSVSITGDDYFRFYYAEGEL